MNDKPIFIYKHPLAFAWSGGRLLIMNERRLVDFGDGGMNKGRFGHAGNFDHNVLGEIHCNDTVFNFRRYNIIFDFNELRNCRFISRNKAKGKAKFKPTEVYHLERFFDKNFNLLSNGS